MSMDIVCLVGATGAGKTAAALHLASCFDGEVVNFDSRQVYRDIPLVTAQPSPEEQAVCPHHLYGYLASDIPVQAGSFVDTVRDKVVEITARGKLPLLVGGTGLYLKTLIQGIAPIPSVPREVRERVEALCTTKGSPALHSLLRRKDPVYASKIHPNDRQRICRALEVLEGAGHSLTWWHEQPLSCPMQLRPLKLGIRVDLQELKPLLERRIAIMLERGAVQEMRDAYARCPDRHAPAFTGIGCPELLEHILDRVDIEETRSVWLQKTRAYAKRQTTWFKRDQEVIWFAPNAFKEMETRVRTWKERL
jgi:tRNA dimethylallyltransferase